MTLAERVIELYRPQTLIYPTTGSVLRQTQTHGSAKIVAEILGLRAEMGTASRALPHALRQGDGWTSLLQKVEETLAEWPMPRLQQPFGPFLYSFDWGWKEEGGWSVHAYRDGRRSISLYPGVGHALTPLGLGRAGRSGVTSS